MPRSYNNNDSGEGGRGGPGGRRKFGKFAPKKPLQFPEEPLDYKNINYLIKFVAPTGKIVSRKRTGFSGQNQRLLAQAIKRARLLGLMPFVWRG